MTEVATRHGGMWVRSYGPDPARVVALHGFTLHGAMFERLAALIDGGLTAPDLPGHGRTNVNPVTMATAVDSVADVISGLNQKPVLLGYSQGGRIALHVALTYPDLIDGLVLVATSPGLDDRSRQLRAAADDGLASRIERIGTERFIEEWLANPIVATDHVAPEIRAADKAMRLENTAEGLAAALRGMGQAAVADSTSRLAGLPMPTAFVAGTGDRKYTEEATAMAEARGHRPDLIEDAGHNLILEAPAEVAAVVNQLRRSE